MFSACLIHAPRYYYGLVRRRIGGGFYAGASPCRQLKTQGLTFAVDGSPLRKICSPRLLRTAPSDSKNICRHLERLIHIREARYFFGLGLGTCKIKSHRQNCCAPKTSDGKSAVGIFRLVSYTRLGTIFGLVRGGICGVFYTGASPCRQLKTAEDIDHFSSAPQRWRGTENVARNRASRAT